MERLLHYVWKHKLWQLSEMKTADGLAVEIIDTGLYNHQNNGPDFFNAKLRIGGTLWVGNVELHDRSSDWYRHGHDTDEHYNNVVLHVVETIDMDVKTKDGRVLPQLQLAVPPQVTANYQQLLATDHYPPCYHIIPDLSSLTIRSWLSALQTERLEKKTEAVKARVASCDGSWETAYFVTLARNYGFGINGDTFEAWARSISLRYVDHHRDNLFQIEALFMGQAGLLDLNTIPKRHQQAAIEDDYFCRLQQEYHYLAHKFNMSPIDANLWHFLRLRPQNFPHIRLSQLAVLYYNRHAGLSVILECESLKQLEETLKTHVSPYWQTHYGFGTVSKKNEKWLSMPSIRLLIINTAIPVLFAYGRYSGNEKLCDRSFEFLEELQAENNHITRMWQECGLSVQSAGDSQALIQLKKEYCDRKDCLRCRIGYEYLRGSVNSKL